MLSKTILSAILALTLSACSTLPRLEVVRPAPARPGADLLVPCPSELETTTQTELSQPEQTSLMVRWAEEYHLCRERYDRLIEWHTKRNPPPEGEG